METDEIKRGRNSKTLGILQGMALPLKNVEMLLLSLKRVKLWKQ
jgi:hypothetical protein